MESAPSSSTDNRKVDVLIHFIIEKHSHDFRFAELDALLEMHGLEPSCVYSRSNCFGAFMKATFPSVEVIKSICSRVVLIKGIYELWTSAETENDLLHACSLLPPSETEPYFNDSKTWSLNISSYHYPGGYSNQYQEEVRQRFLTVLKFAGPVKLKKPDAAMNIMFDYDPEINSIDGSSVSTTKCSRCYLGRLICNGGMRIEMNKYDLKRRAYIGPTSLDHQLAFIMANLAKIDSGSIVLDPFVGTASILVAASHLGGTCFGTDIDIRVLRGWMHAGKKESAPRKKSIFEN